MNAGSAPAGVLFRSGIRGRGGCVTVATVSACGYALRYAAQSFISNRRRSKRSLRA